MDHFLDHMAVVGATASVAHAPPAFQQGEYQVQLNSYQLTRQQHPYLSLLASAGNSRHHFHPNQPRKGNGEEGELGNANNGDGTS